MKLVLLTVISLLSTLPAVVQATTSSTPCSAFGLASSYDVIVVGEGLGGSVAARRLAEANPDWRILVVERGITYESCAACQLSNTTNDIYTSTDSGGFLFTAPQRQVGNASIPFKDASVQGGGTAVNGEVHIRGDAFRYFPENYPLNWNYLTMLNFYKKYENYTFSPDFHGGAPFSYAANQRGSSGPIEVDQQPLRPFTAKYLNAVQQVFPNMPVYRTSSINDGLIQGIGASPIEITTMGNVRVSAYTGYIRTYKGSNLKSITNTLVAKVLFNGTAVKGVNITFNVASATQPANGFCMIATKRVVMSAGAIGTPKVLKLSGVGPAAELTKLRIPVVANVPDVGANFNDQFVLYTVYSGYTDNLVNNSFPDQVAFTFYNAAGSPGLTTENDFSYNLAKAGPGVLVVSTSRTNVDSRGTVTLSSADFRAPAVVDPNYFGVQSEKNASALALFKLRQVARLAGLTVVNDPCAGKSCNTPMDTFNAYIAASSFSVAYHFTSSASLCKVTNPVSLRVQGTSGLYVLDASIMPKSPNCNTQSTLYAVAEYGAQLLNLNMHLDTTGAAFAEAIGQELCLLGSL